MKVVPLHTEEEIVHFTDNGGNSCSCVRRGKTFTIYIAGKLYTGNPALIKGFPFILEG